LLSTPPKRRTSRSWRFHTGGSTSYWIRRGRQFAYVLAEDGTLYRVNLLSAEAEQSAKVVQAYSMDGHWRDPRPILSSPTGTVSTKGRTWDATMRPSL
jgi:hypothetical protein